MPKIKVSQVIILFSYILSFYISIIKRSVRNTKALRSKYSHAFKLIKVVVKNLINTTYNVPCEKMGRRHPTAFTVKQCQQRN